MTTSQHLFPIAPVHFAYGWGVATVLNEIASKTYLGVELTHEKVPVEDQVAGACELLGLDPLYVANEGVYLIFCPGQLAEDVQENLKA